MKIKYKYNKSPINTANLMVNNYICEQLNDINSKLGKDIIIISKEKKYISFQKRKKYDWIWLVDPINGKEEFIKKTGQFTINIELIYKGSPVFGIVGIPVDNLVYYGCKHIGSFKLNTKKTHINRIEISKLNINDEKLRIVIPYSQIDSLQKNSFIKFLNNPTFQYAENCKGILQVGENNADIFLSKDRTIEWNTCAFHAILKYAGGMMKDYDYGNELVYNKKYLVNPYFVCSGKFTESKN
jgi:3'(2'), 5'-bisphosphate nucleotidase